MRLIKFLLNVCIKILKYLEKLILAPFKLIKKIINKNQKNKKREKTRIETIKSYIAVAKANALEISISSNYDNELIIQLHSPATTKTRAKRVTVTENKEEEKKQMD